jgi:hypothetical protein
MGTAQDPHFGIDIGKVKTSLTFQNSGIESGCVAYNGTTAITGSGACPAGFMGGNEGPGLSQTNVYTASALGITDFSILRLVFNGNEGGNAADQPITLSQLGLSLYSTSGQLLATYTLPESIDFASFPGVGNSGFSFGLDATQAASANAILLANASGIYLGTEAIATNAQGGPETIFLATVPGTASPEPGTIVMLSTGLILLGGKFVRKHLVRS